MGSSPDYEPGELRRVVGKWGSFCMGYADVGADIYIALGLIALYAGSAAPIALLFASITYISTGLCYAELASTYPVAGGAQFYARKAFGDLHGFAAGWGLMLDYTINISLFALAAIGYLGFLGKVFFNTTVLLESPYYGLAAIIIILFLAVINLVGLRWSSGLNVTFVTLNLATLAVILLFALPAIVGNGSLLRWIGGLPSPISLLQSEAFVYATSLAIVSYIGIESISQAAEETKYPARVIPAATKATILSVILLAVTMSVVSVTLISAQETAQRAQDPVIAISASLPFIGGMLSLWVAFMGFAICWVSANTGVIGVSRVTFSMGRLRLMPRVFSRISSKYHVPYVTIILFSVIASLVILVNLFLPGVDLLGLVASLYNFGALISYMYVNLSLILLRNKDPTPRAWKIPGALKMRLGKRTVELPLIPVAGFISCAIVWIVIVGTHPLGRLLGTIWFLVGFAVYFAYRRRSRTRERGEQVNRD